jgi:hypothetical protein
MPVSNIPLFLIKPGLNFRMNQLAASSFLLAIENKESIATLKILTHAGKKTRHGDLKGWVGKEHHSQKGSTLFCPGCF